MSSGELNLYQCSFAHLEPGMVIWHTTPGITSDLVRGLGLTTRSGTARRGAKHYVLVLRKDTTRHVLECASLTSSGSSTSPYVHPGNCYFAGPYGLRAYVIVAKMVLIPHEQSVSSASDLMFVV